MGKKAIQAPEAWFKKLGNLIGEGKDTPLLRGV
jgi:hypothetical protein